MIQHKLITCMRHNMSDNVNFGSTTVTRKTINGCQTRSLFWGSKRSDSPWYTWTPESILLFYWRFQLSSSERPLQIHRQYQIVLAAAGATSTKAQATSTGLGLGLRLGFVDITVRARVRVSVRFCAHYVDIVAANCGRLRLQPTVTRKWHLI